MAETELTDEQFERFRALVYEHSGISLGEKKRALVRARFGKEMRNLGLTSYSEYYDHVVNDSTGQAAIRMINAISTNLTSFFRENQHFDHLSKVYLASLVQKRMASGDKHLRLWSAGCSTGEEPYTLSMVIMESVPNPANWDMKILATDIDSNVLDFARSGVYEKKRIDNVPPMLKGKYLTRKGERKEPEYHVNDNLKRLITFRQLNLMRAPWPFKRRFDVIFCRNVMIYFDRPTQERLVNRFFEVLEPGGQLFVGHSESLTGVNHKFKYIQPTVYRRPE